MKVQIVISSEHMTNLSNMNSKKWKATVICLGHHFSKHKITRYAKNIRGHGSFGLPLATSMLGGWSQIESILQTYLRFFSMEKFKGKHRTWFLISWLSLLLICEVFVLFFILVTAIGRRPKPEICFSPVRLGWALLPKKHCGDSLNGRRSKTEPFNWEADTLPPSYWMKL